MPLSVVDLYRDILPKTNCGDCGFPACLAFASIVVSEKLPLGNCPHIESGVIENCQKELDEQYASGKCVNGQIGAYYNVEAPENGPDCNSESNCSFFFQND